MFEQQGHYLTKIEELLDKQFEILAEYYRVRQTTTDPLEMERIKVGIANTKKRIEELKTEVEETNTAIATKKQLQPKVEELETQLVNSLEDIKQLISVLDKLVQELKNGQIRVEQLQQNAQVRVQALVVRGFLPTSGLRGYSVGNRRRISADPLEESDQRILGQAKKEQDLRKEDEKTVSDLKKQLAMKLEKLEELEKNLASMRARSEDAEARLAKIQDEFGEQNTAYQQLKQQNDVRIEKLKKELLLQRTTTARLRELSKTLGAENEVLLSEKQTLKEDLEKEQDYTIAHHTFAAAPTKIKSKSWISSLKWIYKVYILLWILLLLLWIVNNFYVSLDNLLLTIFVNTFSLILFITLCLVGWTMLILNKNWDKVVALNSNSSKSTKKRSDRRPSYATPKNNARNASNAKNHKNGFEPTPPTFEPFKYSKPPTPRSSHLVPENQVKQSTSEQSPSIPQNRVNRPKNASAGVQTTPEFHRTRNYENARRYDDFDD